MIDFQNVSFSYGEESSGGGIRNVNLTINTGEFVLLTGESGCGKTTITRLVNGLVPHYYEGNLEGNVLLDGKSVSDTPLYDLAAMVGSVFQNPKSQFFNVDTDSELAFACENLGYPQEDILKRIDRTVSDYHIEDLMGRSVFALSGGEKQKIACASSSVLLPGIMVLDEPSSNLDMAAIDDLRQVLSLWKKQGKTILIAEHRLYYLHDLADRVLYVKDGEIEREYTPAEFDSLSDGTRKEMGLRPFSLSKLKPANQYQAHTAKQMEFQNFCFAYKKREPESLHIPSAEMDHKKHKVFWNNVALHLTRQEYNFLYLLAVTPMRVYTFEQIYQLVWKDYSVGDIKNIIWCLVKRLRKKLNVVEDGAGNCIVSVRDIGYKFELNNENEQQ